MDQIDKRLLDVLQEGIPLCSQPFEVMGEHLGITGEDCLGRVKRLADAGLIRRLGGVFNSRLMGFVSVLCAVSVPENDADRVAQVIGAFPEVTHNYLRNHRWNIWFTVTAPSAARLTEIISQVESAAGVEVLQMPAEKVYKIKVAFSIDRDI